MAFRITQPALVPAAARVESAAPKAVSGDGNARTEEELKKACADFESIFLSMLFKEMQKSIPKSTLYQREFGEDVYRDMLYDAYGNALSARGGVGLAEILYEQLSRELTQHSQEATK